ncbi:MULTISPECIES: ABC transporter permease [Limibacillus]|jgi:putative spermidine/putrescine transport system permease protein|uniref:Putative spermidine/putrescine transport system permease protein n=1 Tax=Limibacillus halophilus TaxID=1579333 RepID=A0A839SRH2_9PROT|nr:ABC transporter permease [Limibacillus halophilus]MBB3064330.1 putative spermidine/putrescine transport system permease protein [Limibacillus halophilus]
MFQRFISAIAWVAIIFLIAPLIIIVGSSFTQTDFVTFPPRGFTLRWYVEAMSVGGFVQAFFDSLLIAAATMAGAALIGIPTALGLRMGSPRTQTLLRSVVVAPLILPAIVSGIALLQIYYAAGLDAPLFGIIVGHILITVPFFIRTVTAGLESVPVSVLEAAETLGASKARILFRVLLPLIVPSICAGLAFVFIVSFDEVTMSLFFSNPEIMPLPIRIYNYIEFSVEPVIAAISTILILSAFVLVTLLQRIFGLDRVLAK